MNNVLAALATGISVDASSVNNVVVGETAYQFNGVNVAGLADEGANALDVASGVPLFVDPANGNFYPAECSPIIDSSLNWLADRPELTSVRSPLGIPESPIVAPEHRFVWADPHRRSERAQCDGFGGERVQGSRRDRSRRLRRTVGVGDYSLGQLPHRWQHSNSDPNDPTNDPNYDYDRTAGKVHLKGGPIDEFVIQLTDTGGSNIEDATVVSSAVHVTEDGTPLVAGVAGNSGYIFRYNSDTNTIELQSTSGVWDIWHDYTITLDPTIHDSAGNPLQPNQPDGTTTFDIQLDGKNHAPVLTGAATFLPIGEDDVTNALNGGLQVSDLLNLNAVPPGATDADGDAVGIAITSPLPPMAIGSTRPMAGSLGRTWARCPTPRHSCCNRPTSCDSKPIRRTAAAIRSLSARGTRPASPPARTGRM